MSRTLSQHNQGGPTLSVVLSSYNHGHLVARAVEAIMTQSRPPEEFLLFDDGSTDDTATRMAALQRAYPSIRVRRNERNLGTHASNARGREQAGGKYLYIGAADDYVLPGLFETAVELLERHPEAAFCSALTDLEDESGARLGTMPTPRVLDRPGFIPPDRAKELLCRRGAWFRCNTAIYRRDRLDALGGFDSRLGTFGDAFACMLFAVRDGACFIPRPGGVMRVSGDSLSARSVSDAGQATKIFSYAREQMATAHRRHFPSPLVSRWDRRWRYSVARNVLDRRGRGGLDDALTLIPGAGAVDRMMLGLFCGPGGPARLARSVYLGLRLVPWDLLGVLLKRMSGGLILDAGESPPGTGNAKEFSRR